jgi:hypothetical protein
MTTKILGEVPVTEPLGGRRYIKFALTCATCGGAGSKLVPERQAARFRQAPPPRFLCHQCEVAPKL